MYCRLCDIEYPKSLRFCKWCGGGLVARESVGNQHCPSCGSGIEREWVFCNECGVDLATLGAQPRDVVCPACSATVRKGWMFCRQCGEQIATERAAEKCKDCGAGTRANWRFCKGCGASVSGEAPPHRGEFRTVAGMPALPADELEDAPFNDLRSGELPPLDDVMKAQSRRSPNPAPVPPPPPLDGGHTGGTAPLTNRRSTGHLDADALEHEIRSHPAADAAGAAQFGRLEASELIAPQAPEPRPHGSTMVRGAPVVAQEPQPDSTLAIQSPFVPRSEAPAPQPVSDATAAIASPFASSAPPPAAEAPNNQGASHDVTVAIESPFAQSASEAPPAPAPPPVADSTQVIIAPLTPQTPSYNTEPPSYPQYGATPREPYPAPSTPQAFAPPPPSFAPPPPEPQWTGSLAPPSGALDPYPQPSAPFPPPPPPPGYDSMPTRPGFEAPAAAPSAPFPPPAAAKSGSPVKWIVLAVVALFVLGGGAVGAFFAWRYFANQQQAVEAPPPQPAPPPETPTVPTAPATPAVPDGMVSVAGGTFMLGSDDPKADEYSRPAHRVEVKSFYLDATEVTNAQYKAFVDATKRATPRDWAGGAPKPGAEQHPVVFVSWDDAAAYATWAGKRLPTEAEWEFAARGTDGRVFPWGSEFDASKGNLGKKAGGAPVAVGSFPDGKSPSGALDMVGNVWEWTSTDFSIYPGGTATPPDGANFKIIRGGAYDNSGENTALYRGFQLAGDRLPKVGFRCAKDAQ